LLEAGYAISKLLQLLLCTVGRKTDSGSDWEGSSGSSSPALRSALRLLAALVLDRPRLLGLDINALRARDVPGAIDFSMELKGEFLIVFPPSRPRAGKIHVS
jgi:hypothetical protein